MRQERPSRLPISESRLRKLSPLALLGALALSGAACGPEADPYCADGDIDTWLTTFKVDATWIEDGYSVPQIQLVVDTDNETFLHLPDDAWAPASGRVISALPLNPQAGEAKKVILLPDSGVTTMSVRAPVFCQGIREDYEVVLTWTAPKIGAPVDWKLAPAAK